MTALSRIAFPKPRRVGPKPKRRLARRVHVKRVSAKRGQVERADARWSVAIKATSGWECEWCGKWQITMDAHHVYSKRAFPRLRYDLDNGVQLDRACHERAHRNPLSFRAWFAAVDPERWRRLSSKAQRESRLS
jgi:hypothetical protein